MDTMIELMKYYVKDKYFMDHMKYYGQEQDKYLSTSWMIWRTMDKVSTWVLHGWNEVFENIHQEDTLTVNDEKLKCQEWRYILESNLKMCKGRLSI